MNNYRRDTPAAQRRQDWNAWVAIHRPDEAGYYTSDAYWAQREAAMDEVDAILSWPARLRAELR